MPLDQYRNEPYNPFAPDFLKGSTADETTIPQLAQPEPYQFAPEEKGPMESIGSQLLGNVVTKEVNSAFGLGEEKEDVGLSYGQSKGNPHKDITDGAKGGISGMLPLLIVGGALKSMFKN
jgi:hypothetical protein